MKRALVMGGGMLGVGVAHVLAARGGEVRGRGARRRARGRAGGETAVAARRRSARAAERDDHRSARTVEELYADGALVRRAGEDVKLDGPGPGGADETDGAGLGASARRSRRCPAVPPSSTSATAPCREPPSRPCRRRRRSGIVSDRLIVHWNAAVSAMRSNAARSAGVTAWKKTCRVSPPAGAGTKAS